MVDQLKWKRVRSGVYTSVCGRFVIARTLPSNSTSTWSLYDSWLAGRDELVHVVGHRGFRIADTHYDISKVHAGILATLGPNYPRRPNQGILGPDHEINVWLGPTCRVCGAPWVLGENPPQPTTTCKLYYTCGGAWDWILCNHRGRIGWAATGGCPKPAQATLIGLPVNTPLDILHDALKERGLLPMEVPDGGSTEVEAVRKRGLYQ